MAGPRKFYRLPDDLPLGHMMTWLLGHPPYQDRESCAVWKDEELREYVQVDGRLVPRSDVEET